MITNEQRPKYVHRGLDFGLEKDSAQAIKARNVEAGLIWQELRKNTTIDRFHPNIVPREKSVLYGYADTTVVIPMTVQGVTIPVPIKLRGLVVKSLKGEPHLDMPADKGKDQNFYDHFFPYSGPLRAALTMIVFADEAVLQAISDSEKLPVGTDETSTTSTTSAGEAAPEAAAAQAALPTLGDNNPFDAP